MKFLCFKSVFLGLCVFTVSIAQMYYGWVGLLGVEWRCDISCDHG